MKTIKLLSLLLICLINYRSIGQISGTVFRDFNGDGIKVVTSSTALEPGVAAVTVKAYPLSGAVQTTTTSATGTFSFSGLTLPVRIEFSNLPNGNYTGPQGIGSGTTVQFYSAATTSANLGINNPSHYSQANPDLITPKHLTGDPFAGGSNMSNDPALYKFPNTATGNAQAGGTPLTTMATQAQIGSTWGAAYDRVRKKYFVASVYRRHAPLGPGETGGRIYVIDNPNSGSPGTPTKFVDLVSDLGISVGAVQTNAARGLPNNKNTATEDNSTLSVVGKVGLGDIDISDDGQFLFVVNLFDKKVYQINIAQVIAGTPNATALPNFTLPCTNGNSRPWGLGMWDGELYLGVVCDALSGTNANLRLTVQKFNFTSNTWTEVFNVVPDWDKGDILFGFTKYKWQKWVDVWNNFILGQPVHPSPIIGDIEFDEEGSMHIAVLDRLGFQSGQRQMAVPDDGALYTGITGGELLRTYKDPNTGIFSLENNGSCGPYTTGGTGNNSQLGQGGPNTLQGPGGGEFYCDDYTGNDHSETTSGGLTLLKGSRKIASVQMNPIDGQRDAQGIVWFNTTNGLETQEYQIFRNDAFPSPDFSKQNGLGDLEYLSDPAPIEIGNRVWMDTDNDGVQDADEMGLDGVTVKLFSGTTLVSTKTTANGGQYYFKTTDGVLPNTTYTIRIEASSFPIGKFVTLKDQPTGGVQDLGDNDASLVGVNADIIFSTSNLGENNHTLDFGFSTVMMDNCTSDTLVICSGDMVELVAADGYSNYKWYIINAPGDTVEVASGQIFTTTTTGNYIYKATDGSGCLAVLCCPVTIVDSLCCVIDNLNLVLGNCDSKGTVGNMNDDEFSFTINPSGSGLGSSYIVSGLPNSPQVGNYGSPTTFGPYLISGGVLNLTVVDNLTGTCSLTAIVTPPAPCSNCNVTPPLLTVTDNICPSRIGMINLVQDCGPGSAVQYSGNNGLTWSSAKPLYSTSAKTILARCVNTSDTTCKSAISSVTTNPEKCPGDVTECSIAATAIIDPCLDNGTADIVADDYFTIQLNANVINGGSSKRFEVVIGADPTSGYGGNVLNSGGTLYGSPVTVGQNKQFKADGSTAYSIIIRDMDIKSCFQRVDLNPVASCSGLPPKSPCYPVPCVPIQIIKN